jgi:hypothetical protein
MPNKLSKWIITWNWIIIIDANHAKNTNDIKYKHVPSFFRNLTFGHTNFKLQILQILNANFKLSLFNQWRNVIAYQGPPVQRSHSRSVKSTSCAPYMHKLSKGSRACSHGKFFNLESLKCHFLHFGERIYTILMVRKRHCNIWGLPGRCFCSTGWAWAPIWPIGVGGPRSEPIVVTPLYSTLCSIHVHKARARRKEKIWPASLNFEARTKH